MSWPTYLWATLWCVIVGLGLWFSAQSIWLRAHHPQARAFCVEHGGVVQQTPDGFMCTYPPSR